MIGTGYIAASAFAVGLLVAGTAQQWRFEAQIDREHTQAANTQLAAVKAVDAQLVLAQSETEKSRQDLQKLQVTTNAQIDDIQHRLRASNRGLRIKAKCPASVPANATNASGVDTGTAELDAASTSTVLGLEKALNDQFGLLQFCRSELQRRSLKSAP